MKHHNLDSVAMHEWVRHQPHNDNSYNFSRFSGSPHFDVLGLRLRIFKDEKWLWNSDISCLQDNKMSFRTSKLHFNKCIEINPGIKTRYWNRAKSNWNGEAILLNSFSEIRINARPTAISRFKIERDGLGFCSIEKMSVVKSHLICNSKCRFVAFARTNTANFVSDNWLRSFMKIIHALKFYKYNSIAGEISECVQLSKRL